MRTAALISGGKDSCFNMMCCIAEGHDVVALANLRPENKDELDSYMFQTVGHHAIDLYAEAMDLPLFTQVIEGSSLVTDRDYQPQVGDEVEDLYKLLSLVKTECNIESVSVGAILSDYQRVRVENVCQRLNLVVLSFLWRRDQDQLLREMIDCGVRAIIIKVAAMGLDPSTHLGLELHEIYPHMVKMKSKYGLNICGEGGEYETFVFDAPIFKKAIVIDGKECVIHSDDAFAPVGYLNLRRCHLQDKQWDSHVTLREKVLQLPIMTSDTWASEMQSKFTSQDSARLCSEMPSMSRCITSVSTWKISDEIQSTMRSDGTNFQVSGIRVLSSDENDVAKLTKRTLDYLMDCVIAMGHQSTDITSMSLYVGDMADFAAINSIYKTYFNINPPVRLCVQACLESNIRLQIDCQGRDQRLNAQDGDRKTMHVQALSHWAPANIGPYSQAVLTGGKLYMAGVIPLVPATLGVIEGGITVQCAIALVHIQKVMEAMHTACNLRHCPLVMCFVTNSEHIQVARHSWHQALEDSGEIENLSISQKVQYCIVPMLPKHALVEWQVYAWSDCSLDIKEVRRCQRYEGYSISVDCTWCRERPHLFSCWMSVGMNSFESPEEQSLEAQKIMNDLFEEYLKVHKISSAAEMTPMAKILFSPHVFNYCHLEKCVNESISRMSSHTNLPVISLVPVISLETEQQIIAWCQ